MNTKLTPREREAVRMVAHGNTNKQIATALGISVNTVKSTSKKYAISSSLEAACKSPTGWPETAWTLKY